MNGPLHGIRILDLSRVLAGPWATQLLGDYGADVIKVERPGSGDDTRNWGPPWLRDADGNETGESAYFLSANRNKRSMTVDLAQPAGQDIIGELATRVDVLIENFRVGTMQRFGLHAEALQARNPGLVYCSISGFGQHGSRADRPGYDAMIQAAAGLMSLTGKSDEDGGEPRKVGIAIADIMTGMYAATAIIAALYRRASDGVGEVIDLSLHDSQVAWLANQGSNYLVSGAVPGRLGNAHPNIVPYESFRTQDGHIMLAVGNDRQFSVCVACIGLADLASDSRFSDNAARVENRQSLIAAMQSAICKKTTQEWLDVFAEKNIPAGPINELDEVLSGEFAAEREYVRELPHPLAGKAPGISNPVRFSRSAVEYRNAPPLLGQHTAEILADELGYSAEQIRQLADNGIV